MLAKIYRLPSRARMKTSKMYTTNLFTLKTSQNSFLYNRFGFIVSKKIDKRAVVRNRVKRQLRSCIEKIAPAMKQGNDMLFVLKREAVGKQTRIFDQTLRALFTKENFL